MTQTTRQPDFLIAGATRSGTSTLHTMLSQSPHIFMPRPKELHFFQRDYNYSRGIDAYESYFASAKTNQLAGEASPGYFEHGLRLTNDGVHIYDNVDDAAQRVARHYTGIKLIFSLRDPVERVYSIYQQNYSDGRDTAPDFETAIRQETTGERDITTSRHAYLYYGFQGHHLARWRSLFPHNNIHVMIFGHWTNDPAQHISALFDFLDAPLDINPAALPHSNRGRTRRNKLFYQLSRTSGYIPGLRRIKRKLSTRVGYTPLSPSTERWLRDYFHDDITALEDMLGLNLAIWKNRDTAR